MSLDIHKPAVTAICEVRSINKPALLEKLSAKYSSHPLNVSTGAIFTVLMPGGLWALSS